MYISLILMFSQKQCTQFLFAKRRAKFNFFCDFCAHRAQRPTLRGGWVLPTWWVAAAQACKGVVGFHPPGGEEGVLPTWRVKALHPLERPRPPPTMRGGPTLHGGWASVHGVQRPVSPQGTLHMFNFHHIFFVSALCTHSNRS